ncbi:branched-chain amino acid aminotransferase [Flaviflexus huanghaiensis]|uniref:branched-chain amino acid aminotransferase n=1 Tax=Flaviflexus huanghaiensis TaxID=1111473 RepID=UPI0015FC6F6E|nr:branched-chain amino acid aminotransferase [Flaviflexus huanghaiensis]
MTQSALEQAAALPLPTSDEVAGRWEYRPNPAPASSVQRNEIAGRLSFGVDFTDHMAHAVYEEGKGWHGKVIEPYGPLLLDPAAAVLHYGQEIFEGLKAYRHDDGSIWTFRPGFNAHRLNASARRLAVPELPVEDFLASIVGLVRADEEWVPSVPGSSLYLRPFIIATEPFLGVRAARRLDYLCIASPSGPYFVNGFQPISVWVSPDYHRAGPGGTGAAKCGGNYASSLVPKLEAYKEGYDEVCFLDAATNENIDELGGMNVFVVYEDGSVSTPVLTGSILEGGTRGVILRILRDRGVTVREETIPLKSLVADISSGRAAEVFACGTAAVVTPIGRIAGSDFDVQVPGGDVTRSIYDQVTAIQLGHEPDPYGWTYRVSA